MLSLPLVFVQGGTVDVVVGSTVAGPGENAGGSGGRGPLRRGEGGLRADGGPEASGCEGGPVHCGEGGRRGTISRDKPCYNTPCYNELLLILYTNLRMGVRTCPPPHGT